MTAHHFIKDPTVQCPYCGKNFDMAKWRSKHHIEKHYKEITCSCGRASRVTVEFCGSGHDTWTQRIIRDLEERLR